MSVDEFGTCDENDCFNAGYYLVRDRDEGIQVKVCGIHLGSMRGEKK